MLNGIEDFVDKGGNFFGATNVIIIFDTGSENLIFHVFRVES